MAGSVRWPDMIGSKTPKRVVIWIRSAFPFFGLTGRAAGNCNGSNEKLDFCANYAAWLDSKFPLAIRIVLLCKLITLGCSLES